VTAAVRILLCEHVARAEEVVGALAAAGSGAEVVEGLCTRAAALEGSAGEGRLVLGLCERRPGPVELQARARRAGLGPFDVEVVPAADAATAPHPAARLAALLRARAEGLAAREGPSSAHLRLELAGERLSRRSLLAGGPWTYRPVAAVGEGCLGADRCGICAWACPVGAIDGSGRPGVDAEACRACGACVSACPVGAATLPDADLPGLEAELAVLVEEARSAGAALSLACRAAPDPAPGEDRVPLRLPCLSIVTAGWLLQLLAAGVPAVVLAGCGDGCRVGGAGRARAIVDTARRVVAAGGASAGDRVRLYLGGVPEGPAPAAGAPAPSPARAGAPAPGSSATAEGTAPVATAGPWLAQPGPRLSEPWATTAAAAALLPPGAALEDLPAGPGALSVTERCTLCGLCASVCPTGAVALETGVATSTLTFDPASCAGCGNCVRICPEGALRLSRRLDPDELSGGRRRLRAGAQALCRSCGGPVAPGPMLERIGELLAHEEPGLLRVLTELCPDCRAAGRAPAGGAIRG
jgi:ferredoxin